jgi:hypothetical protein
VDLTTPFGGAGINANVGLPASGNNILTTAVIGLGISSLVITVAAIVIPFFNTAEKKGQRLSNRGMGDKCIYHKDSKKWPNVHLLSKRLTHS